jgi:hypothetical protein
MDDIEAHLREALETNEPAEKDFHIRHALQLHDRPNVVTE